MKVEYIDRWIVTSNGELAIVRLQLQRIWVAPIIGFKYENKPKYGDIISLGNINRFVKGHE